MLRVHLCISVCDYALLCVIITGNLIIFVSCVTFVHISILKNFQFYFPFFFLAFLLICTLLYPIYSVSLRPCLFSLWLFQVTSLGPQLYKFNFMQLQSYILTQGYECFGMSKHLLNRHSDTH